MTRMRRKSLGSGKPRSNHRRSGGGARRQGLDGDCERQNRRFASRESNAFGRRWQTNLTNWGAFTE